MTCTNYAGHTLPAKCESCGGIIPPRTKHFERIESTGPGEYAVRGCRHLNCEVTR